jgi:bifunctional non-homologous end joining protein LigD
VQRRKSSHPTHLIKERRSLAESVEHQLQNGSNSAQIDVEGNIVSFSHLDKVLWPGSRGLESFTKRDLAVYMARVSPYLLEHLKDRPLTMIRYPNGINSERFFQKHADEHMPEFIEKITYFTEDKGQDLEYILCNNLATLMWCAQMAALELHTVHFRLNKQSDAQHLSATITGSVENLDKSLVNYPDFLVFDLDCYLYSGKEMPHEEPQLHRKGFSLVRDVAYWLREMLDHLAIKSFVKISGKTGLHIYVPIVRNLDYDTVRAVAAAVGHVLMQKHRDKVTMEWRTVKRTGKVFFDHNMNARGKTLASPYSPRNSAQATVSAPIEWSELESVYPTDFTIATTPAYLKDKHDPWLRILEQKNDLLHLLEQQPEFNGTRLLDSAKKR